MNPAEDMDFGIEGATVLASGDILAVLWHGGSRTNRHIAKYHCSDDVPTAANPQPLPDTDGHRAVRALLAS